MYTEFHSTYYTTTKISEDLFLLLS